MKTKALLLLLATLMLAVGSSADNAVENVMGTVKAISANSITVEAMGKTRKPVTLTVLPSTKFTKDGTEATVKDLKIEDRVLVSVRPNGDKVEAIRVVFGQTFQHMDMHHK
jgi:hypothetical protein